MTLTKLELAYLLALLPITLFALALLGLVELTSRLTAEKENER